jgi:hypothetical protein
LLPISRALGRLLRNAGFSRHRSARATIGFRPTSRVLQGSETAPVTSLEISAMGMLSDIFTRVFPVGHPAHRGAFLLAPGPAAARGALLPVVDVPTVLGALERRRPDRLAWHSSIVDLMRLLGLDATIDGKDRLADELRYPGGAGDTTVRDRWLHRRLMQVLAAHGARLPAGLVG